MQNLNQRTRGLKIRLVRSKSSEAEVSAREKDGMEWNGSIQLTLRREHAVGCAKAFLVSMLFSSSLHLGNQEAKLKYKQLMQTAYVQCYGNINMSNVSSSAKEAS